MSALAHDERCEKYYAWQFDGEMICRCAERALTVARQREEAAKGEIARLREERTAILDDFTAMLIKRDALRAENARLTLAASESARTLQVEITDLRDRFAQAQASWHELDGAWQVRCDALQAQVTALREALNAVMWVESKERPDHWMCAVCSAWKEKDTRHSFACIIGTALAALPQDGA